MATAYQPLFNRTYLKVLPWLVALAILLLSLQPDEPTSPQAKMIVADTLWQSVDTQQTDDRLWLLYSLAGVFSQADPRQRRAFQLALTEATLSGPFRSVWQDDMLLLSLPVDTDIAIRPAFNQLQQRLNAHLPQAHQQANAEAYLDRQQPEAQLLAQFYGQLCHIPLTKLQPRLLLSLARPPAQEASLRAWLNPLLDDLPALDLRGNAPQGLSEPRLKADGRYYQLLGQFMLLSPEDPRPLLAAHLLADLLPHWPERPAYRVIHHASALVGANLLIVHHRQPLTHFKPADLVAWLPQQSSSEQLLAQRKNQLHQQYRQQLNDPAQRLILLARAIRFDQPLLSAADYQQQLADVTWPQVQATLDQWLNSPHTVTLLLPANPPLEK